MSKHTPGPWYVGREDENTGEIEVNSDGRPYVCLVLPGAIDEVTPANARLIAAAPELFDFARDYISAYQNGFDGDDHLMLLAKSLVAKVTGETHG